MEIAVASGKGGTGKTTISLSLTTYYRDKGFKVALLDCDVEEPNANLFLNAEISEKTDCKIPLPKVDNSLCTGCGKCDDLCEYSAIVLIKGKPLVLPEMCHSCGGCALICPEKAITEVDRIIGIVEKSEKDGIKFAGGRLNIGEVLAPPLIDNVKGNYPDEEIRILDSPPGTSCPVIESVKNADFLLLVAEPTPFGLNDLKLAAGMGDALGLPSAVVINKGGENDHIIKEFCESVGLPVIDSIPDNRAVAEKYSRGDCISIIKENYSDKLEKIAEYISIKCRRSGQND
ncbi:MAG TPA: ATP-binding protein [Spirochaetota bacterium]|nr:ATP-binding protein [Spirochaetota bacterium]HPJ34929.1 ATP-binding protein [Spirochaetota bacterium]